jgi:hypothetical protein
MNWKMCAAIGLLLLATGCAQQRKERPVSEKEFGKAWSLTVSSGTLVCIVTPVENRSVFFISPDGKRYNVINAEEYLSIFSILKPAPSSSDYKFVNPELLLKKGMKLCPESFWLAPP